MADDVTVLLRLADNYAAGRCSAKDLPAPAYRGSAALVAQLAARVREAEAEADREDFGKLNQLAIEEWADKINCQQELATLRAERDGPPGRWVCATCGFQLTTSILRAVDGAVGVDRREVEDICPNDGTSMRRVTWQEDAEDANRVGLEQMKRADAAEKEVARLRHLADQLEDAGRWLREEWWFNHGCPFHALYGDDGEMQCNALDCRHDFKREPLTSLREFVQARRLQIAAKAIAAVAEPKS